MHGFEGSSEFLAGHLAPEGCYVRVDVPNGRKIILERPGPLPASLDGSVAVYERLSVLFVEPRAAARGGAVAVAS